MPEQINKDAIQIDVTTRFLAEQSDPQTNRFVFSYQITIHNHLDQPVQLLRRHWTITDGDQHTQEIDGEGVVGEQPVIQPNSYYQYSSGAVLPTQVGSMQGYYTLEDQHGERFEALIPAFTLAQPNALH